MNVADMIPADAICEIVSKRQPGAKYFRMPGGKETCIHAPFPLHYPDKDGQLQTCDTTIQADGVHKALHDLTILPAPSIGFRYQSKKGGGAVTVRLHRLDGKPVKSNDAEIVREGSTLTWKGVADGLDIVLIVLPHQAELFKVLHHERAPRDFQWAYIFHGGKRPRVAEKTAGWDAREIPGKEKAFREVEIQNSVEKRKRVWILNERYTGRAVEKDHQRRKHLVEDQAWPVVIDATVTENIAAAADDVAEYYLQSTGNPANTLLTAPTQSIKMGVGTTFNSTYFTYPQFWGGFRFQSLAIPSGSTIDSAELKLFKASVSGAGFSLNAFIDDVADAAAWTASNRPSQIARWPAYGVAFNMNSDTVGSAGATWTANVQTAMQRILDKTGWASGNDVRFAAQPTGSQGITGKCWAFEKTTNLPVLEITYTPAGNEVGLLWNVLAAAGQSLQVDFNTLAVVQKNLQLDYHVFINIDAPKDLELQWSVNELAGQSLEIEWRTQSLGDLGIDLRDMVPVRPDRKISVHAKGVTVDLRGHGITGKLGKFRVKVDALEILKMDAIEVKQGKLFAVGEEKRDPAPAIPPRGDEDAILLTLALIDEN